MADQILFVEIASPEKQIWEGNALSVSSVNSAGPFDILPMHANFITIVENQSININTGAKTEKFLFPNAIIYASRNKVIIYTL